MVGKQKCNILKEIRRKIAEANDIPYKTRECTHTGECSGTCPYCESEVRYLEKELKRKASLGKQIKLAAVCAGAVATVTGCTVAESITARFSPAPTPTAKEELSGAVEWTEISGEVPAPEDLIPQETDEKTSELNTVPVSTSSGTEVQIIEENLTGMVAYPQGS